MLTLQEIILSRTLNRFISLKEISAASTALHLSSPRLRENKERNQISIFGNIPNVRDMLCRSDGALHNVAIDARPSAATVDIKKKKGGGKAKNRRRFVISRTGVNTTWTMRRWLPIFAIASLSAEQLFEARAYIDTNSRETYGPRQKYESAELLCALPRTLNTVQHAAIEWNSCPEHAGPALSVAKPSHAVASDRHC